MCRKEETVCESPSNPLFVARIHNDLWPLVNFLHSRLMLQLQGSHFAEKKAPPAWRPGKCESSVVPVYQLRENLHFNWIPTCRPNNTCWVTGVPSDERLAGLKCESTGNDRPIRRVYWRCRVRLHVPRPLMKPSPGICFDRPSACVCVRALVCALIFFWLFDGAKIWHESVAKNILGTWGKTAGNLSWTQGCSVGMRGPVRVSVSLWVCLGLQGTDCVRTTRLVHRQKISVLDNSCTLKSRPDSSGGDARLGQEAMSTMDRKWASKTQSRG